VLFNPPQYLVASIDAPTDVPSMPIFVDTAGPFGGIAGVTKTIPGGSLRHIDQNIETAYAHFYGVSFQHELGPGNLVLKVEYSGSKGRKLYDLADPNKPGAGLIYQGVGTWSQRPNTSYTAFNTRANRGESDYNGVNFGIESRRLGGTGLQFSFNYTLSHGQDNLSSTFSDSSANYNLGYLDAFDPMLDYGDSEFDVRHRVVASGIWAIPYQGSGLAGALLGDWQLNFIFAARTGFPFTLWDCTSGYFYCMRALDPVGLSRSATKGTGTGNPNEFALLDLSPLVPYAGSYVNPVTGTSDFGPYPSDMTERDAFRGPGYWNVDLGVSKRIRFGPNYAVQFRLEAYNLFNHPNMYVYADQADLYSTDTITGYKDGNRVLQLGFKFEF